MTHKRAAFLATLFLLLTVSPRNPHAARAPTYCRYTWLPNAFRAITTSTTACACSGNPVTDSLYVYSYPAQYFEKGRIEDHGGRVRTLIGHLPMACSRPT